MVTQKKTRMGNGDMARYDHAEMVKNMVPLWTPAHGMVALHAVAFCAMAFLAPQGQD